MKIIHIFIISVDNSFKVTSVDTHTQKKCFKMFKSLEVNFYISLFLAAEELLQSCVKFAP